jgi:hypothetical protein
MSASKLGRFAGLVIVLVAILGVTGGELALGDSVSAVQETTDTIEWL